MKKLTVIDLFAGCGGLSEGFEMSRCFDVIAFVEWDKAPCDTLVNRLQSKWKTKDAGKKVGTFDIQKTKGLINGWEKDPCFGNGLGLKKLILPIGDQLINCFFF